MWLREQAGVITTRDTSAFDRACVDACFADRFPFNLLVPQDDRLYVSIDPSGGGFSQTACVAACVDGASKCVVIMGADGCAVTNDEELEAYVRSFLERLRLRFPNTTLVVIIERNFGGSVLASRIADIAARYPPLRALSGDATQHRRVGVVTTETVKERGRVDVQRLLRTDALRLLRDEEFLSGNPRAAEGLREQLLAFKYVYHDRPSGVVKASLSGKGYGKNDDLVLALMLAVFTWARAPRASRAS